MITRVKEILTAPKKEWAVIAGENTPHAKLFIGYVLPLSLIPAIAAFIGYGLIGYSAFGVHIHSIYFIVSLVVTIVVSAVISAVLAAILLSRFL